MIVITQQKEEEEEENCTCMYACIYDVYVCMHTLRHTHACAHRQVYGRNAPI